MNYLNIIIPFVGGLGMFIYGMQIMAQGLENAAGNKMKSLLEVLTKNKLMGVLLEVRLPRSSRVHQPPRSWSWDL